MDRQAEAQDHEIRGAAEFVAQVVHVSFAPIPLLVVPAQELVPAGVPAEAEHARLGVVQMGVAFLLIVEEVFQGGADGADLGIAGEFRAQQHALGTGDGDGKIGVVAEHHGDHAPVENLHDPSLGGLVGQRRQAGR